MLFRFYDEAGAFLPTNGSDGLINRDVWWISGGKKTQYPSYGGSGKRRVEANMAASNVLQSQYWRVRESP